VAHLRIVLDHADYALLDAALSLLGWQRAIPGQVDESEAWWELPPGSWWSDRDGTAEELREGVMSVLSEVDELGAQVVVTVGESAWAGLVPTDAPVKADEVESKG
jgi:hypothetical protein